VTQAVLRPEDGGGPARTELARSLGSEFVIAIEGTVAARPPEMINSKIGTGEVEVIVDGLRILNDARTPPFTPDEAAHCSEDLRLEYRYLDLRRPDLISVLALRHRVAATTRRVLEGQSFLEIETPMLVRPTPEGARDYLVPSRVHPGSFYALPQSPQLYKQILMVSGVDRYYQLARCLRDEDLRADRQPEHTQIDLEMSFVGEEDIHRLIEGLMTEIWRTQLQVTLELPFPRMTYREAMARFGSDKPDLRFGFELVDLSEIVRGCGFAIFEQAIEAGGGVRGLVIPGGGSLSRKAQDELEALAQRYGARGLARAKVADGGLEGGVAKFLPGGIQTAMRDRAGARPGDLLVMVADRFGVACRALGAVRSRLGQQWLDTNPEAATSWRFLWVNEFPVFEEDGGSGRFVPAHHMFTMPMDEDLPHLESDPARVRGKLYDLVLNGFELGSGSIRIHRRDIQEAVMRVIGMSAAEAEERFGFLLKAFQYGAPPHGGIALGLDRIIMLMAGRSSLRDTIAFPKTTSAASLMDGCPAPVEAQELAELRIRLDLHNKGA
ncbi:MAG: aspartate--tRNA ligase, partial [Candidatus Eisenbacteria bacterium]|nr:aspartate--tRNA ligase [Candidatus Eisenbacteria bacterium]